MRALEAHYKVEKQGGFTSLPLEAGNMGLNDRRDFIAMFKKKHRRFKQIGKSRAYVAARGAKILSYNVIRECWQLL